MVTGSSMRESGAVAREPPFRVDRDPVDGPWNAPGRNADLKTEQSLAGVEGGEVGTDGEKDGAHDPSGITATRTSSHRAAGEPFAMDNLLKKLTRPETDFLTSPSNVACFRSSNSTALW